MEIRPILSAMMRNKTGAVLVALQTAITLAVIVNAIFIAVQRVQLMNRPSGMDEPNVIFVDSFGFGAEYRHQATVVDDLAALRALPGVVTASAMSAVPLSGGGSAQMYRMVPEDDGEDIAANYYQVDENALQALGVTLAAGRNFRPEEILRLQPDDNLSVFPKQVIVTRAFAEKLFGTSDDVVGKLVYNGAGDAAEVIGVLELMHGAWVHWSEFGQVMLQPIVPEGPWTRYAVRVEPGSASRLMPQIEETLAAVTPYRVVRKVRTLEDLADRTYAGDRAMAIVLLTVIALLIVVTASGIVGLASFSVKQRTKQIGTRRAVGARRGDILRYFLTENWLMMTFGLAFGTVLTLALNYYLASEYSLDRLDPLYLPLGIAAMWALGLAAVFAPARRAAQISPAIATRTV